MMRSTRRFICVTGLLALLATYPAHLLSQGPLQDRLDELSRQIAQQMTEYQKTTIAVTEFSDLRGNVTDFGRFLAEELITRLYQTGRFKVIERQLLNRVIAEQKLTLTGVVDPESAKELGRVLGVDAIASGTITELAQHLRINARLISSETGEIFAVASTQILKDESVTRLMAMGTTAPQAPPPERQAAATPGAGAELVEADGFRFRAMRARRTAGKLVCLIQIENTGSTESELRLLGARYGQEGSVIYDDLGNEYGARIKVGNRVTASYLQQKLIPALPVNVEFIAEDVSPDATSVTLVIRARELGRPVTLRNIPITP